MNHQDKINWMILWCHKNKVRLELDGECGFGRECVGILASNGCYPDYYWYNQQTWKPEHPHGDVFVPPNAYHKHDCVAVLGRGEGAEAELYDWLKWFDDNDFTVSVEDNYSPEILNDPILMMMGRHQNARMVKKVA